MPTDLIVLAAGKGSRMKSALAKVLHPIVGQPMLGQVIQTARTLAPRSVTAVLGYQAEAVGSYLKTHFPDVSTVVQVEQLGTGHAVQVAMSKLQDEGISLVLYGDVPLIDSGTLAHCVEQAEGGHVALVTATLADPAQLGRIVRGDDGAFLSVIEYRDASDAQRQIKEINSGIMAAPTSRLRGWLAALQPNNAQGEYYLTDIFAMAVEAGVEVRTVGATHEYEVAGVNDRAQLAALEREHQRRLVHRLMREGVSFADPDRVDIRGTLEAGEDCFIDVNAVFTGRVVLGRGVQVGANSVIMDAQLGDRVVVNSHTVIEQAQVSEDCVLGPFARIRPGSDFGPGVRVGNFVETKKAILGAGTKANHLAYLGDATIGTNCNIGAGAITCNYDGVDKHQTTIGDQVFIGTNSTLVAPLEIGDRSFTAAGSTVTSRVDDDALAVARAKQRNIAGWRSPSKRKQDTGKSEI